MRIKFMLLTVVLSIGLAQTAQAQDMIQGFSGIAWGTSVKDVRDLKETARSGDIRYYERSDDFYSIAGVTLPNVIYGFYQEKYFAAYMQLPASSDAFNKIKHHLDTVYGDARAQLRIDRTIYIWEYIDVKIKLKQYGDQTHAKLAFYYMPLSTQVNAKRQQTAKDKVIELDSGEPEYDF
jgi:hypothetical protein